MSISRCAALFILRRPGKYTIYGSAVYVGQNHILTAAHNFPVEDDGAERQILVTVPGLSVIGLRDLDKNKIQMTECELLSTGFRKGAKRDFPRDMAILKTKGFISGCEPQLSRQEVVVGLIVDVVGFPASFSDEWVKEHPAIANVEKGVESARKMLPARRLISSRGTIEEIKGGLMYYKLSTCPGMSGGLIRAGNKIIGIIILQRKSNRR